MHIRTRAEEPGTMERYPSWSIQWRLNDFSIRNAGGRVVGTYSFFRIILPLEIVADGLHTGYVQLLLDPGSKLRILGGVPTGDLEKFKRRVSAHVLAAVRTSTSGCADCAREARMSAFVWDAAPCPGCRQPYCRNQKCLRRLNESKVCRHCGTPSEDSRPWFVPLRD